MNVSDELKSKLKEKGGESKKWIMSIVGLSCVMFVYLTSVIVMVFSVVAAPSVLSIAMTVITFIGSLVGVYVTGQSLVDWKHTSAIENIEKTDKEIKLEEFKLNVKAVIPEIQEENSKEDVTKIVQNAEKSFADDPSYAPQSFIQES